MAGYNITEKDVRDFTRAAESVTRENTRSQQAARDYLDGLRRPPFGEKLLQKRMVAMTGSATAYISGKAIREGD